MVSTSTAPGLLPIPGTRREVEAIYAQLNGTSISSLRLEEEEATVQATTLAMENYSCIHLACHGSQDRTEPLNSRFYLHDGSLDLSTILNSNLKNTDLAFLSACETSVGDARLSEEVVHLAAGMLAAGYRGVVGTMWSINDAHAPQVAEEFYQELIKRSGGQIDGNSPVLDGRQAAFALRHAVQRLRGRLEDSDSALLSWVPYVHFGL
jgi:CHAT domain-containing protein